MFFFLNVYGEDYTRGCALSIRKSRSRSSCFSRSPPPLEISWYQIHTYVHTYIHTFFSLCPSLSSFSLSLSLSLSTSLYLFLPLRLLPPLCGPRVELHEARPCVLADNTHVELRTLALHDAVSYIFIIFFPCDSRLNARNLLFFYLSLFYLQRRLQQPVCTINRFARFLIFTRQSFLRGLLTPQVFSSLSMVMLV